MADPPIQLFSAGADLQRLLLKPCVAVVGSRRVSSYGRQVTIDLVTQLVAHDVVIISGLAYGVDSIAHQAALEAGGRTIAVLPSSIQAIYPSKHQQLAERICHQGGALVTEYDGPDVINYKYNFIARNRIIAGLADAVLITEAALKSGSLHTARFANEQGRDVLAVPGSITNITSVGTNNLIKSGARPVTGVNDILDLLGITATNSKIHPVGATTSEQAIIDLLATGMSASDQVLLASRLAVSDYNQSLTMLEIQGVIRPLGNNNWALR